ncbi:DciA family protein [Noviherbaspirillum denitrificans]|uniref:DUF721 domain-containing protein n=1 Tax=Noviherbaspirillum denitrificans TaxID=1968433 RepID=A0A254TB40_9BURK|nr:DciA family protein [Noviherbaspirillum denitrificans]OWW19869.1 hypothetical protein AYR66_10495 [Noviherbaspirillum denitrificans]
MSRPPFSFASQQRFQPARASTKPANRVTAATDFLRTHDKMATLLPAVMRLAALQEECSAVLPALFDACSVMRFDGGQLTIGVPNAALAAKLKQQLPKLQESLLQRGWQVNAIRIKVQVRKIGEKTIRQKEIEMPNKALSAFEELRNSLDKSPGNQALTEALNNLLKRHR